jgi:phosphoserine phosphatase SerB
MQVDLSASNVTELRDELFSLSAQFKTDVTIQAHSIHRTNKRLVIFDMDSTLIQCEVIDEIARESNILKEVATITESAMRGEIDFTESLTARVKLLKGTKVAVLETVRKRILFTEGARELTRVLKGLGVKMGVVSGMSCLTLTSRGIHAAC